MNIPKIYQLTTVKVVFSKGVLWYDLGQLQNADAPVLNTPGRSESTTCKGGCA